MALSRIPAETIRSLSAFALFSRLHHGSTISDTEMALAEETGFVIADGRAYVTVFTWDYKGWLKDLRKMCSNVASLHYLDALDDTVTHHV